VNNKEEDFIRQIELTIHKSQRLLKTARVDFESGDYDSASSRAYYAVFHMMEGALLFKGLSYSKHSGVIAAFNLNFIKPGVFPKEFSKHIENLFEQRQIGDYDVESNIYDEEAEKNIRIALEIVSTIEEFIKKELRAA
jgi:uncharacterized protein (UPF0332 family)